MSAASTPLRGPSEVGRLVRELGDGLFRALAGAQDAAIVGVRRGGVALAGRLADDLQARGLRIDRGTVDVALYRDDVHLALPRPESGPTEIAFAVEGRDVVLVDDVFWTGRTARAAMDAVLDFGRPRRLWLCVLATRPRRELPIVPDVAALAVEVAPDERLELRLVEDGHPEDELVVVRRRAS